MSKAPKVVERPIIKVARRGNDVEKLPNPGLFEVTRYCRLPNGATARQQADGTWLTALNHKAAEGHKNLALQWRERCFNANDMFDIVTKDAKYLHDDIIPLANFCIVPGNARAFATDGKPDNFLYMGDGSRLTEQGIRTLLEITRPPRVFGKKALQDDGPKDVALSYGTIEYELDNSNDGGLEEAAKKLNRELQKRIAREAANQNDKTVVVRKRNDAVVKGLTHARAFVSERYGKFDNAAVIEELLKILPAVGLKDLLCDNWSYDGDVMSFSCLIPDSMHKHANHGVGFTVSNSEDTRERLRMSMYIYAAICVNGCRWGKRDATINISAIHSGTDFRAEIADQMKTLIMAVLTNGKYLVRQMELAGQIGLKTPIERLLTAVANRKDVQLTREQIGTWFDGYGKMADLMGNRQDTIAHAVEGLTFAAGYYGGEDRARMETIAGDLLSPSIQADVNAIGSHWENTFRAAEKLKEEDVFQFVYVGL